jgi:hypothetical protein
MSIPLPFSPRDRRDAARQDWIDARRAEARAVIADVAHHSDRLIRIACNILVQHGETGEEREDARLLLVILDARAPLRAARRAPGPEDRS